MQNHTIPRSKSEKIRFANKMKRNPTRSEEALHNALLSLCNGLDTKIQVQWVIGPYIADFVVNNVVIEVDGWTHLATKDYDDRRTSFIESRGYKVWRTTNEDVFRNVGKVARKVMDATGPHNPTECGMIRVTLCPPGSAIHGKGGWS